MASKVKHRLNIFLKKTVKLSKHKPIFALFMKIDPVADNFTANFDLIIIRASEKAW